MKINELLSDFEIFTTNEEAEILKKLKRPVKLGKLSETEQFRIAAATYTNLLLSPSAHTHKHAHAIINSLFHTALAPCPQRLQPQQLPPLQCAAVAALSSSSAAPPLLRIITSSLSFTDVVALTPTLPPAAAAGVARMTAAAAVDADSAGRLVQMGADVLLQQACVQHPKSKELRQAAGRPHVTSPARACVT